MSFLSLNASAASESIRFGYDLCSVSASRDSVKKDCENNILDQLSSNNVYSIALHVCVDFGGAVSSRISDCFIHASQWIVDNDLIDKVKLCNYENHNYVGKADCLRNVFYQKNLKEAEKQQVPQHTGRGIPGSSK